MIRTPRVLGATALVFIVVAAGCGSAQTPSSSAGDLPDPAQTAQTVAPAGIRLVTPNEAAGIQTDPPTDLVILDVRTPEEFDQGHLDGATMLDFYRDDLAGELAKLDPDQPYLLYCRSGNRSGQTIALMKELGFSDVADIDGGILAWEQAGLPIAP